MRPLDKESATAILKASRLGTLSMSDGGKAYAIPLYYGYDGSRLFFHCHPGLKERFIDTTKEACLVVIHVNSENVWESVQAFGTLERLSLSTDIQAAKNALFKLPFPPVEGNYPSGLPRRSDQDVFYLALTPSHIEGKSSAFKGEAKHEAHTKSR